jgi:hypothetical protein
MKFLRPPASFSIPFINFTALNNEQKIAPAAEAQRTDEILPFKKISTMVTMVIEI